jgi:opacity protein-like surface antigen
MRRHSAALLAAFLCAAAPLAGAAENGDLDLIPHAVDDDAAQRSPNSPAPAGASARRLYVENAFTLLSRRGGLIVPAPPPAPFDWQNRTSLDAAGQWDLTPHLGATFSDRFNLRGENDLDVSSRQTLRNDFREGYLTWEPSTRNYLETGRINLRNGVALGFNPTDFFKTRSQVDQASLDPSVLRQNRLGTFMLRGQAIGDGASASVAFAPALYAPTALSSTGRPAFDPRLDRTNAADRLLLSVNFDIADLSPQALIYREGGDTRFGLDVSRQLGQSVVGYAEWAGGRQHDLIDQAIRYGKETGTLPGAAPTPLPSNAAKNFRNDLAIGASWTSTAKITVNLEYHYHQAGFSRQDWRNWFAIGGAQPDLRSLTGTLWYIRGYANDQQQPLTQQQGFLRIDWTDALVSDLELTAFAFVDLYDGSSLAQLTASYYLSNAWTIGGFLAGNFGGARSEHGSAPQAASAIFQLVRYF